VIAPPLPAFAGLPEWGERLVVAAFVVVGAAVLLGVAGWLVPRIRRRAEAVEDPARSRQRRTALAILSTAIRYAVVIAAIVGVVIALSGGGALGAVTGGALVLLVLGFASQRFLADVIAGIFILFEDQYGVGDFVRLEPSGYTGVVEELGVRTTVLRDLNEDRLYVPNGQITAVRRVHGGWRTIQIQLVTSDPVAVGKAVGDIVRLAPVGSGRLFLREPRVVERKGLPEGLSELRVHVDVAPALQWVAEGYVLDSLRERAGDVLVAEPVVEGFDPTAVARGRTGLDVP
jgi:small conductance mechanosensitive channel